jgi:prepilin signal peptidase PulO-like enzyme (type II secretory pathway)
MNYLFIASVFVFGTLIGSFLNVVILRLPKGKPLTGRSRCPRCGHVLTPLELVPVFSFLFLGKKCSRCRKPISWRYAGIELLTGSLFALLWIVKPAADAAAMVLFARDAILVASLVVVFATDFEHYLIFDKVLVFAGTAAVSLNIAADVLSGQPMLSFNSHSLGGLFSGFLASLPLLALWAYSKGMWMGFGDVKFMLFLGIAVGWPAIVAVWLLAFFLGAVISVMLLSLGKKRLGSKVPFGTFLSVAALIVILWGNYIIEWYLAILGI